MGYEGILVSLVISSRTKDKKYNEIQWESMGYISDTMMFGFVQRKWKSAFGNLTSQWTVPSSLDVCFVEKSGFTIGRLEY
jgi:hypothetical protein